MSKRIILIIFMVFTFIFSLSGCGSKNYNLYFWVDGQLYYTIQTSGKDTIEFPKQPVKDNFIFKGWYEDENFWNIPFTYNSLINTSLKSDKNIYAKWEIRHDQENNLQDEIYIKDFTQLDDYHYIYKVSNSITTFNFNSYITVSNNLIWSLSSDISGVNAIPNKAVQLNEGDNVFYASFTNNTGNIIDIYTFTITRNPIYRVSFNFNNDSKEIVQYVENGGFITPINPPSKKGYTFKCWDGDIFNPITADVEFNAIWEVENYTLTYNLNGGINHKDNVDEYNIEQFNIVLNKPSRVGYTFVGWYTENTYINNITSVETSICQDITIYARWEIIYYNISYHDTNWRGGAIDNPSTYTIEDEIHLNNPSSKTVDFAGWKFNDNYISTIPRGTIGDLILYADWTLNVGFDHYITSETCKIVGVKNEYKLLDTIVVPQYVQEIADGIFKNCYNLKNISFIDCVYLKTINTAVFEGCSNVTNINFINCTYFSNIGTIFKYCTNLQDISFTNCTNLSIIDNNAFKNSVNLNIATFTNCPNLTTIGDSAFENCTNLSIIKFTNCPNLTTIGDSAFENCKSLSGVDLSDLALNTIGSGSFKNCYNLSSLDLRGTNIVTINNNAFENCKKLCFIQVLSIEDWCLINFKNKYAHPFSSAEDIITCLMIEDRAVIDLEIPNIITEINAYTFYNCYLIESVDFKNCLSLTAIGDSAFENCSNLTNIDFSNTINLTNVGCDAFKDCENIKTINISNIDKWYYISFGNFKSNPISIAKKLYLNNTIITSLIMPKDITEIKPYAFYNYTFLENVDFKNCINLITIGSYAFANCGFESLDLSQCVNLTVINSDAFAGCSNLSEIDFSNTLKLQTIEGDVFENCYKIKKVNISNLVDWCNISFDNSKSNPISIAKRLYLNNTIITSLIIPKDITEIKPYTFTNLIYLECVDFTKCINLSKIGYCAFEMSSLISVDLSYCVNLTVIDNAAFYQCDNITSVNLSNCTNLTSIGNDAFYKCDNITSVNLSNCTNLTTIGNEAFVCCEKLLDVDLSNCISLETIGESSFYFCTALQSVDFTNCIRLKIIKYRAFSECNNLTNIDLSTCKKIIKIESYAFYYCEKLKNIYLSIQVKDNINLEIKSTSGYVTYK